MAISSILFMKNGVVNIQSLRYIMDTFNGCFQFANMEWTLSRRSYTHMRYFFLLFQIIKKRRTSSFFVSVGWLSLSLHWICVALQITALMQDPAFRPRLLKSYRLMLDFYGMQLVDEVWMIEIFICFSLRLPLQYLLAANGKDRTIRRLPRSIRQLEPLIPQLSAYHSHSKVPRRVWSRALEAAMVCINAFIGYFLF